jgi:hypothetical protein
MGGPSTAHMTPIERVMRDVVVLDNGCWQWQGGHRG